MQFTKVFVMMAGLTAHLAIVNPLAGSRGLTGLFRTHLDTAERVTRLQEQAKGR
jgi:hypothetical protein